jgi:MoaA/NifB/PqqE/SkfB family radical SAM enzyme
VFIDRLTHRLEGSYDDTEDDPDLLEHDRWLGQHLQAFLHRLVNERPAAARAVLRFIATWITDMHRRTDFQEAGRATPCTVVLEPTDRCNLNCPGCYAKSTRDGTHIPYEQMVQIVREVIDLGVTLVTISGGEPFIREQADRTLTRLAAAFPNRGFLVYTNGTLIDEPTAERLAGVGNVFPAISVEGNEHQTDDRRGRGVYEQNRRARRYLADHGVMCGFSATVTSENAESICTDDFIDLRIEEGDLFGWFFLLQPIGRSPRLDLMVSADQRAMLRETINRWRKEHRPIFLGDFWNDGPFVGGCIAGGRYYFHIYADGNISPCVFAPVGCGNVFDIINGTSAYESLDDLVQNHPTFRGFREEQDRITDRARPCLLIDHPDAFRRVYRRGGCYPGKNMAPDYLEGAVARHIDQVAAEWRAKAQQLPPIVPTGRYEPREQEAALPTAE